MEAVRRLLSTKTLKYTNFRLQKLLTQNKRMNYKNPVNSGTLTGFGDGDSGLIAEGNVLHLIVLRMISQTVSFPPYNSY